MTDNPHGTQNRRGAGINLLRFRPIRWLLLWSGYPYIVQGALLAAFLYLAYLGWGLHAPEGVQDKLFAKTNLVNLAVWGLWWPIMVWLVVLFGRLWCAVCPLELVANATERLGRIAGIPQKTIGSWLRSGLIILLLYLFIQMLVAGIHLHRVPAYTSIFLFSLLVAAAVVGLIFKDRAFCRGFCPVGLLLSVYGRGSMLAVRPISRNPCDSCGHRSCTQASFRNRLDGRSCPSLLNPARLNASNDCLVCGQCIKVCRPERAMGLFLRSPYHASETRESSASWTITLFTMLLSGFVAYELCTEWLSAKALFLQPAEAFASWIGLSANNGWIKGIWMLFVFPLLLWLLLGGMILAFRGARSLAEAWRRVVWPLVPLIAAGHMAKGLAKVSSWSGYFPLAQKEPAGLQHAEQIAAKALAVPEHLISKPTVALTAMALIVVFTFICFRENTLIRSETRRSLILPILIVSLAQLYLVRGWGFGG